LLHELLYGEAESKCKREMPMTTPSEITRMADLLWYLLSASLVFLSVDFLHAIYRKAMTPKLFFRECWPEYRLLRLINILLLLTLFYVLFPPTLPGRHYHETPNEKAHREPDLSAIRWSWLLWTLFLESYIIRN